MLPRPDNLGIMSPTEQLAIYAVENKAIIYVLVVLLIVSLAVLANVTIQLGLEKLKSRERKRMDKAVHEEFARRGREITRLTAQIGDVQATEAEIRRLKAIRSKTDAHYKELTEKLEAQDIELKWLRAVVTTLKDVPTLHEEIEPSVAPAVAETPPPS